MSLLVPIKINGRVFWTDNHEHLNKADKPPEPNPDYVSAPYKAEFWNLKTGKHTVVTDPNKMPEP